MNKDSIELIIFDMDGVVLDSEPLHENARQMMFGKIGIVPDGTFPDPVGKSSSGFWRKIIEKCKIEGEPYELEALQYRLVAEQIRDNSVPPSDGLVEVLEWARGRGIKIGLASSSTRVLVDKTLEFLGVKKYFAYTVSGDEVKAKKPAPDVYLKVLEEAGVEAARAVAVEDSRAGVEAARGAGIYCFGYRNETSGSQDISGADKMIGSLREIIS